MEFFLRYNVLIMKQLPNLGVLIDNSIELGRKHLSESLAVIIWPIIASIPFPLGQVIGLLDQTVAKDASNYFSFGFSLLGAILIFITSIWTNNALILTLEGASKKLPAKTIYRQAIQKIVPVFLIKVLVGIIIFLSILPIIPGLLLGYLDQNSISLGTISGILFFVGGIIALILLCHFALSTYYANYQNLLLNQTSTTAIKASLKLVKDRWWHTAWLWIVPKIILTFALLVALYVNGLFFEQLVTIFQENTPITVILIFLAMLFNLALPWFFAPGIIATDYTLFKALTDE